MRPDHFPGMKPGMAPYIDLVDLAGEITEIATATTDAETARRLLELVDRLLTAAGFPGGGDLPPGPLHGAQVDLPEIA